MVVRATGREEGILPKRPLRYQVAVARTLRRDFVIRRPLRCQVRPPRSLRNGILAVGPLGHEIAAHVPVSLRSRGKATPRSQQSDCPHGNHPAKGILIRLLWPLIRFPV